MNRRLFLGTAASLALVTTSAWSADAAAVAKLPDSPMRVVVPYPPGGTFDLVGRRFARALSERLGNPVVVENIPGAGAALAVNAVSRAQPDGTTLLILPNSTLTIVPQL